MAHGSAWTMRPKSWRMLPAAAKAWLSYRVLALLEDAARKIVQSHKVLGPLAAQSQHNAWAITPAAMLYIWQLVERTQPRSIIEFGSGQSTRLFAAYAQRMSARGRSVTVLSVEHDEHWLEQTRTALERAGQLDYVQFHHAPLVEQQLLGRTIEAYSLDRATLARAAGGTGFDLCFIDGPTGTVGRAGCLPLAAPFLANDASVLLDDALRASEQAVIREWQAALGRHCKASRIQLVDRHGMLHLTWQRPISESRRPNATRVTAQGSSARGQILLGDRLPMQFVAVAPNPWDGQWMNRQHLMWAVKEHAPVVYVQEPEPWYRSWKPRDERFFRSRLERKAPGLSVLRLPKALCSRGRQGRWNAATNRLKARLIDSVAQHQGEPRIFYFWHPELFRYIELLRPVLTVYHMFDRVPEYYEPRYAGTPMYEAFQHACALSDIVVCGTPEQAAVVQGAQPVIVPNGVAIDWYEGELAEPDDIANIPRPRIGYSGTISQKLDFGWFEKIAEQHDWQLVMVGPVGNLGTDAAAADFRRLCSHRNVHYLGTKTATSLPAYLKSLDVGLMNYRHGMHTEAGSPLKLYEYAAAGLPMVATRMASMVGDPEIASLVALADSPDEAVDAVAQALALGAEPENIARRMEFARHNSWQHRAQQILQLVKSKLNESAHLPMETRARRNAPAVKPDTELANNSASRISAIRST
ncbi:MAG: glycosyltransferase [Planctomycetaceae bacterium]